MADTNGSDHRSDSPTEPNMQAAAVSALVARRGRGEPCGFCDKPIGTAQIAYQLRFRGTATPRPLHLGCYFAWQAQRTDGLRTP